MARGEAITSKVHYKGKDEDFIVFVENAEQYKKWQSDRSIPLVDVVGAFKVFLSHKQGAQGNLDGASHQVLDNEFGTHKDDDVIKVILEKGDLQEIQFPARQGNTNDSKGAGFNAH